MLFFFRSDGGIRRQNPNRLFHGPPPLPRLLHAPMVCFCVHLMIPRIGACKTRRIMDGNMNETVSCVNSETAAEMAPAGRPAVDAGKCPGYKGIRGYPVGSFTIRYAGKAGYFSFNSQKKDGKEVASGTYSEGCPPSL